MRPFVVGSFVAIMLSSINIAKADEFAVDISHSSVSFKVSHLGVSWVHGRFNDFSGSFSIDREPEKSTFALNIKTESVDTNSEKRDDHLRAPDFFNAKQFPAITFKSTSVKAIKGGFEVTGDLELHGVSKKTTFTVVAGKTVEFPKGTQRTGFSTDLIIKRSEFGMDKFTDAIGDEVHISISLEGTKK